jgi:predicted Zn finger-like uncharacterized protein
MDVRCERCGTEYEFDDALVSGRGTTVKCTNCGHKFKIRRSDGDFSEDFWNVRTGDGRTLVFTSLRELQRAIQAHQVERADMLSRGGLPPKAIGGIPELTPFFDPREAQSTKGGTLPPAAPRLDTSSPAREPGRSRPPPPPGAAVAALAPPAQRSSTRPEFPAPPAVLTVASSSSAGTRTLPGTGEELPVASAARSDLTRTQPLQLPPMRSQPTLTGVAPPSDPAPRVSQPPPLPTRARSTPPPPPNRSTPPDASAPPPPMARMERAQPAPSAGASDPPVPVAAAPRASASSSPSARPPPPAPRSSEGDVAVARTFSADRELGGNRTSPLPLPPLRRVVDGEPEDSRASYLPRERRPVGGYVIALAVLVGVGMLGTIWARDNLGKLGGKAAATATVQVDPRIAVFLGTGEQALMDGNLELAKESFDKASVVAEKDARVLLGVARLAAARADVVWLQARLVPADATEEPRVLRERLAELGQASRRAADEAIAVASEDPAALRTKIDALRIMGDRAAARALVAKLGGSAAQPETAYVLAALDLAETEPLWPSVIERLRNAAASEAGPGRGRAALVYAFARAGDLAAARTELDRLAGMTRQHPLVPPLRAFLERSRASAPIVKADAGAGDPRIAGGGGAPGGGGGTPGDPRQLVAQAEAARAKGEYERARGLYAAAIDKNPSDSEALHGLAAIAHAQRDLAGAKASYRRVLAINPSYLPSLIGLADVDWDSGDRSAALKAYKEIIDRFPPGTYPARIQVRLDAASGGGDKPAPAPEQAGGG